MRTKGREEGNGKRRRDKESEERKIGKRRGRKWKNKRKIKKKNEGTKDK